MRIACLQFAPVLGDVDNNLTRAEAVLSKANPQNLDILVLPELAFTGYNFKSLEHISPFLEPSVSGISSLWARTTALKYNCYVTVGYPEKVDITPHWPASPEYYNSAITVNGEGETVSNYRKTFLYYTDETWALESPDGFHDAEFESLGCNVVIGICMDLNPYKFETPFSAWEFAFHVLHRQANLVILSMAWLTREDARSYSRMPKDPDMETLSYWLARLEPLIRAETEGEIIVVFANRCGIEDDAVYAGTSAVLGIESGEVKVYGILGRGERELLVVDTDDPPMAKLIADCNFASSPTSKKDVQVQVSAKGMTPDSEYFPISIDEVILGTEIPPVSPIVAHHPHPYFSSQTPGPEERDIVLKSSAGRKDNSTPAPHDRPASPKSRNASRTRQPVVNEPALIAHDLVHEPAFVPYPMLGSAMGIGPHSADAVTGQVAEKEFSLAARFASMSPRPRSTSW